MSFLKTFVLENNNNNNKIHTNCNKKLIIAISSSLMLHKTIGKG